MGRHSTAFRYLLFQVPGWVAVCAVIILLVELDLIDAWWAAIAVALWLIKDAAMYPLVRGAYASPGEATGAERLVGETGVVTQPLRAKGYVRVRAELWRAELAEGEAWPGERVRIIGAQGLTLRVRKVGDEVA